MPPAAGGGGIKIQKKIWFWRTRHIGLSQDFHSWGALQAQSRLEVDILATFLVVIPEIHVWSFKPHNILFNLFYHLTFNLPFKFTIKIFDEYNNFMLEINCLFL